MMAYLQDSKRDLNRLAFCVFLGSRLFNRYVMYFTNIVEIYLFIIYNNEVQFEQNISNKNLF